MRLLFLGDMVGKTGRTAVWDRLPGLISDLKLDFVIVNGENAAGGFGTTGPGGDAEILDPDILLVPLSVFDGEGQRIGYGAGHYDRAIARLHAKGRQPVLIGIAFDCQEVASVPAEPHDVALHAVLTESGLRWFSAQR